MNEQERGFHLYLLVFPFVYQFYSIIEALVSSSFANDEFRRISASFQHHFKIYLLWLLHEKESSFYYYLFCCTEMTWMFIISTTIWVNGWDTSSVASRARSELTSSKCNWKGNWKGKGTDETPHSRRDDIWLKSQSPSRNLPFQEVVTCLSICNKRLNNSGG